MVDPDKTFKHKLDNLARQFDIKKKYPTYFTQNTVFIFRLMFGFTLFLLAIVYFQNGTIFFKYSECPLDSERDCLNPFYICQSIDEQDCSLGKCEEDICLVKHISPGAYIGNKPNKLAQNFNLIFFATLCLGFLLNHMRYLNERYK